VWHLCLYFGQAMRLSLCISLFFVLSFEAFSQATIDDVYNFLLTYGTDNGEFTADYNNGILVRSGTPLEITGTVTLGGGPFDNTVGIAPDMNTVKLDQNGVSNQIQIAQDGTKNNVKTIAGSTTTVDNTADNAVWVRWQGCQMSVKICQQGSDAPLRMTYDTSAESPFYPSFQTQYGSEDILSPYQDITENNNATAETVATMHDVSEHVAGGLAIIGNLSGVPETAPSISSSVNSPTVQLNLRRGTQVTVGYSWSRIAVISGLIRQLLVGIVGWFTYWSAKQMIVGALVGTKMSEDARKLRAASSNPFAWQPPF